MIAPVVFCTIVSGITALGDTREIGKTLAKAMASVLCADGAGAAHRAVVGEPDATGRGHAHRPEACWIPRWPPASPARCNPRLRRLRAAHHPGHASSARSPRARCCRCCCSPSCAASACTRCGAVGTPRSGQHRRLLAHAVRRFRHHHAARPIGAFGAMAFTVGRYGIGSHRLAGHADRRPSTSPALFFIFVLLGVLARDARIQPAGKCCAISARNCWSCWALPRANRCCRA